MCGGAMVGLQSTALKAQLGPLLNGIVNFETWMPVKSLQSQGSIAFLTKYRARANVAGTDAEAYFPVMAYADLQVLGDAIAATKSLNDEALAKYTHVATFSTVAGDIKFGVDGEWAEERMLAAQFQNIKKNSVDEFRDLKTEVVVCPPQLKSGDVIYPYVNAITN
jgi:branched-chain amino acid transport system substrate-binding protein